MLFSRYALAIHDMQHYLAWIVIIKKWYSVRTCFLFLYFFLPYSSVHLTRKPYGYFRCPGNKINAVLMWFVLCCMIRCLFMVVPKWTYTDTVIRWRSQNRRHKVFNRGFMFVQGDLTLLKLTKLQRFIVLHLSIWGVMEHCLGGLALQSLPRGYGTGWSSDQHYKQTGKTQNLYSPIDRVLKPVKSWVTH